MSWPVQVSLTILHYQSQTHILGVKTYFNVIKSSIVLSFTSRWWWDFNFIPIKVTFNKNTLHYSKSLTAENSGMNTKTDYRDRLDCSTYQLSDNLFIHPPWPYLSLYRIFHSGLIEQTLESSRNTQIEYSALNFSSDGERWKEIGV